jgi:predicted NBD/HSP70 family sugar kinase
MDKQGKNQDDLQKLNRSLVMRLIHKLGVCSRAELAKRSGLTKASITGITQLLIDAGVVKEVGLIDGAKGRRSIGLSLCLEHYLCVGIRLTRKDVRGGLFDVAGEIYADERRLIPDGRKVLGIGLAVPGPVIYDEDKIAYMSAFPGWENISIKKELFEAFGIPVLLEHDGVCFALSEWWDRDSADFRLLVAVLAGQGVGAGLVDGGRPIRGALGCAGEMGHMSLDVHGPRCDCGNFGCLEKYASTLALEKRMAQALETRPEHPLYGCAPGYREILKAAREGDELSALLFTEAATYLGYGIVNIINLLNPDIVVVTDSLAECDELMQEVLERTVKSRLSEKILSRTKIVVKPSSEYLAMQAATSLIVDMFLSSPIGAEVEDGGEAM